MNKGYIVVSDRFYKNDYDVLSAIFLEMRPTHIEFRHWENNEWYIYGESEMFEPVAEGDAIPRYEVIFESTEVKKELTHWKFKVHKTK